MNAAFSPTLFDDIDQFRELIHQLGWEAESTQMSSGPNQIRFDSFAFPELFVAHHHVKQMMHDVFYVPPGHVVLAICRARLPAICCGMELPPTLLAILRPGRTYQVRLPAEWETYEFTISEALIERTELFPRKFWAKTVRMEQALLPLVEPQYGQFIEMMDFWFRLFGMGNGMITRADLIAEFYDRILQGLQQLIDAGIAAGPAESPRLTRRPDLVTRARDFMIPNLTLTLTADEIAQALGVSRRVLNYAFDSNLGIGPYQYFLTEKLHAARRKLKTCDASVLEAASSFGFSTPSRFARHYQRLFGELPSETKKQFRSLRVNCS